MNRSCRSATLVLLLLVACAPKPLGDESLRGADDENDPMLARVAERTLRLSHLLAERAISDTQIPGRFRAESRLVDLLHAMADREVLFAEGWRREETRGEVGVQAAVWRELARELVRREVARTGADEIVTNEELRTLYEARKDDLREPKRVRIRSILKRSTIEESLPKRDAKRRALQGVLGALRAGRSFADAARAESDDAETSEEGGDLGWFDANSTALPDGARGLTRPGDLSSVVDVGGSFRIYQLADVAPARHLPFDVVREKLREQIVFRRVRERLALALRAGR